jgi:hypothetical protein
LLRIGCDAVELRLVSSSCYRRGCHERSAILVTTSRTAPRKAEDPPKSGDRRCELALGADDRIRQARAAACLQGTIRKGELMAVLVVFATHALSVSPACSRCPRAILTASARETLRLLRALKQKIWRKLRRLGLIPEEQLREWLARLHGADGDYSQARCIANEIQRRSRPGRLHLAASVDSPRSRQRPIEHGAARLTRRVRQLRRCSVP